MSYLITNLMTSRMCYFIRKQYKNVKQSAHLGSIVTAHRYVLGSNKSIPLNPRVEKKSYHSIRVFSVFQL